MAGGGPAQRPWIGVDLDGTLAEYHGWDEGKIGKPIPAMVNRIYRWLDQGRDVKIFTARAAMGRGEQEIEKIKNWLLENGLPALEVTNAKDLHMIELWDDRCVQVIPNTDIAVSVKLRE